MAFQWNNAPSHDHQERCEVVNEVDFDLHAGDLAAGRDEAAVRVAASLARAVATGDGLRVFDARDELVRRWSAGRLSFVDNDVKAALFCALEDRTEMTLKDRQGLTATVFGYPATGLPPGTRRNERFGALFAALLDLLVEQARRPNVRPGVATATRRAVEAVHQNLVQVITDVVDMRAKEVARRARTDLDLLLADPVLNRLSPRRQLWELIAELVPDAATTTFNEQMLMADCRNAILALVEVGVPNHPAQLQNAVDAAVVLRGIVGEAPPAAPLTAPAPAALSDGQRLSASDGSAPDRVMSMLRTSR